MLPVTLGTIIWIIVGLILVLMRDQPAMSGRGWWIGVCAVGAISGLGGIGYLRFRRARDARRAVRRNPAQANPQ